MLLLVLAYATRGHLTERKLRRIIDDLRPVMGAVIEMVRLEHITTIWANFGYLVHDGNIEAILNRWIRHLPVSAVRLRVILDQASGAGLTNLDVVARALHEHPHFPWDIIRRLFPKEWEAAKQAITVVGDNQYYGYRRDLTNVRSTQYKYLSSICGRILMEVGSDTSLENYKGFVTHKPTEGQVGGLIKAYIETQEAPDLESPTTQEERDAVSEMLEAARGYPSVNQGL